VKVTPVRPVELAVTVLAPAAAPRVRIVEAWPCALVVAVVAERLPPPVATAKVTATLATALPLTSVLVITKGCASAVATRPDWLLPEPTAN